MRDNPDDPWDGPMRMEENFEFNHNLQPPCITLQFSAFHCFHLFFVLKDIYRLYIIFSIYLFMGG